MGNSATQKLSPNAQEVVLATNPTGYHGSPNLQITTKPYQSTPATPAIPTQPTTPSYNSQFPQLPASAYGNQPIYNPTAILNAYMSAFPQLFPKGGKS